VYCSLVYLSALGLHDVDIPSSSRGGERRGEPGHVSERARDYRRDALIGKLLAASGIRAKSRQSGGEYTHDDSHRAAGVTRVVRKGRDAREEIRYPARVASDCGRGGGGGVACAHKTTRERDERQTTKQEMMGRSPSAPRSGAQRLASGGRRRGAASRAGILRRAAKGVALLGAAAALYLVLQTRAVSRRAVGAVYKLNCRRLIEWARSLTRPSNNL
jgi:hypothetical protein